mmetsp:Transcript_18777/g.46511  ORF Transcript_18777/g.46511 Transcript_18777/m.46511 type:complete len:314 (+) Transcript_18777:465-1406(+)
MISHELSKLLTIHVVHWNMNTSKHLTCRYLIGITIKCSSANSNIFGWRISNGAWSLVRNISHIGNVSTLTGFNLGFKSTGSSLSRSTVGTLEASIWEESFEGSHGCTGGSSMPRSVGWVRRCGQVRSPEITFTVADIANSHVWLVPRHGRFSTELALGNSDWSDTLVVKFHGDTTCDGISCGSDGSKQYQNRIFQRQSTSFNFFQDQFVGHDNSVSLEVFSLELGQIVQLGTSSYYHTVLGNELIRGGVKLGTADIRRMNQILDLSSTIGDNESGVIQGPELELLGLTLARMLWVVDAKWLPASTVNQSIAVG